MIAANQRTETDELRGESAEKWLETRGGCGGVLHVTLLQQYSVL